VSWLIAETCRGIEPDEQIGERFWGLSVVLCMRRREHGRKAAPPVSAMSEPVLRVPWTVGW
jgi:hypothetical protein